MSDVDDMLGIERPMDDATEAEVAMLLSLHVEGRPTHPWAIRTLGQADWVMQRVADIEARARDYGDEVARWQDALRRATIAKDWLVARLQEWGLAQRTASRKTFPLAHGTVATRAGRARIVVTDDDAALAWAKANCPAAVETVERLVKSRLSARIVGANVVSAEGEVIPGLSVEVGEATASVVPLGA